MSVMSSVLVIVDVRTEWLNTGYSYDYRSSKQKNGELESQSSIKFNKSVKLLSIQHLNLLNEPSLHQALFFSVRSPQNGAHILTFSPQGTTSELLVMKEYKYH